MNEKVYFEIFELLKKIVTDNNIDLNEPELEKKYSNQIIETAEILSIQKNEAIKYLIMMRQTFIRIKELQSLPDEIVLNFLKIKGSVKNIKFVNIFSESYD